MGTKALLKSGTKTVVKSSGVFTVGSAGPDSLGLFTVLGTATNTRTTTWGSGVGFINMGVKYAFGTEDAAKIFFDTGGQVRIELTHATGTAQDDDWNALLGTRLGQVRMGYTATSTTGSSGLSSTIGYVDLTTTYQTIVAGTDIGGGSYATNDALIEAKIADSGASVVLRVTLTDQHENASFDMVSSGTKATFTVLKALIPSGIVTPTNTVTNSF